MTGVASSSPSFRIYEKATLDCIAERANATPAQIEEAVLRAHAIKRSWSRRSPSERVAPLRPLRELLIVHADELVDLLSRENGKPRHESRLNELVPLVDTIDWLIDAAPTCQSEQTLSPRWMKHRLHRVERRALGVTAILSPFNFPLLIAGIEALSAVVMGCSVIIKPSEHCPLTVERFVQLSHRAGFPADVLQILLGGAEVGRALIDANVDAVRFTGSRENGRSVARRCAEALRPYALELGGNCPLLVLDDAELERTAQAIVFGALSNSGQTCLGVSRILVPKHLEGALARAIVPHVRKLRQGNPLKGSVELGALTTRAQVERCRHHVTQAIEGGAELLLGGNAAQEGHFYAPTLLSGCHTTDSVVREETFGPVIALVPYDDERTAILSLNSDPLRLVAYVFGNDLKRAAHVARDLDYGQVVVNHVLYTYICPEVPLCGFGDGGLGTTHGLEGLLSYGTPQLLSTPQFQVPAAFDFSLMNPERADSLSRTFLRSTTALHKLGNWWKR